MGPVARHLCVIRENEATGGVNVVVDELLRSLGGTGWQADVQILSQRDLRSWWKAAKASDVVLATNIFSPAYAAWALGALLRKPVVAWVHGPLEEVLAASRTGAAKRLWLRWLYRRIPTFVFISRHARASFEAFLGQRLPDTQAHVIPNAVANLPPLHASPASHGGMVDLGYVGRLSPEKQPERLIDMLRLLPANHRLTLVGDGPLRTRLQELSTDLVQAGRLVFKGEMPRSQAFSPAWRLTVLASRYEGSCPLSALESASMGIPFVSPPLPALRETASGAAACLLAPSDAPQALADTAQAVLALPGAQLQAALAQVRAQHRPDHFAHSWRQVLDQVGRPC